MSMSDSKITPVGLGSAAIVGGAAGVLTEKAIAKTIQTLKEAKPDTFMGRRANNARSIKAFLVRHFGKDAFIKYGSQIKQKAAAIYHSTAMRKTGAFLKHPVTIGVAAGVALYIAAKKLFANNSTEHFLD